MRRNLKPWWLLPTVCFGFSAACSHAPSSALPLAFKPCQVSGVGPVDSSWRQVRASGFTFCIPGTWRPGEPASDSLDPKSWSGQEGSVTWGLGRPASIYPPGPVSEGTMPVVVVPRGALPNPGGPTGSVKSLCLQPTATPITIDSVVVSVTQTSCHSVWTTTAWSAAPSMYVQGEAHTSERAKLLNAIIVTIRFGPLHALNY